MLIPDKILTVAKVVWDNMPLTNKEFNPESVNACAEKLKELLDKKHISQSWIDTVFAAEQKRQPIYIDLNDEWMWNFLTMKSGTRDDIIRMASQIDPKKIKVKYEKH